MLLLWGLRRPALPLRKPEPMENSMKKTSSMPKLAILLALLYAAFWSWQTPGWLRGTLTLDEVDAYLEQAEKNLVMPDGVKAEVLSRLRAWALADDGQPVFMLNLMRYYPQVLHFDGAPEFDGTPQQANALYEDNARALALKSGSYPLFESAAKLDNWSRVILMRYPSRRAVLELFSDSDYAPWESYKLMALQVVLVPTHGEIIIPELRWLVGGFLLVLFTTVGWFRAAGRARRAQV